MLMFFFFLFNFIDPSGQWRYPCELETESLGEADRVWRQIGTRGAQPCQDGIE